MAVIKLRRGTQLEWTSYNPVLAEGEPGVELDTMRQKIGDGVSRWLDLPYFIPDDDIEQIIDGRIQDINGDTTPDLTILFQNGLM